MRIKLDENIPVGIASHLTIIGHDVDTVLDEKLGGQSDEVVWKAAQSEGRFFITQDLDFSDIRRFAPGTHHGILLIRLYMPDRSTLFKRIAALFADNDSAQWNGCFLILGENKLRIIHPRQDK
jgi:predicted nuclease of predicted toxin-antitoxin system